MSSLFLWGFMKIFTIMLICVVSVFADSIDDCRRAEQSSVVDFVGHIRRIQLGVGSSDVIAWVEGDNEDRRVLVFPTWPSDISAKGRFFSLMLYAYDNSEKLSFEISAEACFNFGGFEYYRIANVYMTSPDWVK